MENQSYSITLLIIIVISALIGLILAVISLKSSEFRRELDFFNMEIKRAANESEREHWIKRKKKFKRHFLKYMFR